VTSPDSKLDDVGSAYVFSELAKKYFAATNQGNLSHSFGKHERLLAAHLIKFDEVLLNFVSDLYPHKVIVDYQT
jgi:hypothetical protein